MRDGLLPDPRDELLHQPWGDTSMPWKDTWYFSLRDEESDQALNMHMTISANREPGTRVGVSISRGAQVSTQVLKSATGKDPAVVGNSLCTLQLLRPTGDSEHELRMIGELEGVCDYDITLRGQHFASYWDTMFPGFYAVGKTGQTYSHYEQMVVAEGWICWSGGPAVPFSGVGWRDRGWGRRKTEKMFDSGWDLVGAVLPDRSVFSFIALRNHERTADSPMPVGGWRSDTGVLAPLVAGTYHKDAMAWPTRLALEFSDGFTLVATKVRDSISLPAAWHDAEVSKDGAGVAPNMRDYWAVFADEQGREFPLFTNHCYTHRVDVFRGAEFAAAAANR